MAVPVTCPRDAPRRVPFACAIRIWFATALWKRILLGLALGIITGLVLQERAVDLRGMGDVFFRLIHMLVVPLVFIAIVAGVAATAGQGQGVAIMLETIG